MTELGPKARSLIESGRGAYRAQPGDRERIEAALRARLGPEALPLGAAGPAPARLVRWKLAGAALGTGVASALIVLWALGTQHGAVPQSRAVLPRSAPLAASAPTPAAPADVSPDLPNPQPAAASPTARSGGPTAALAQEVQLLKRAMRGMSAGQPERALSALNEHQRRFPNGALSEERRAARAQALCALGRVPEGRAELARLTPRSAIAARAAQACDAAATKTGEPVR